MTTQGNEKVKNLRRGRGLGVAVENARRDTGKSPTGRGGGCHIGLRAEGEYLLQEFVWEVLQERRAWWFTPLPGEAKDVDWHGGADGAQNFSCDLLIMKCE